MKLSKKILFLLIAASTISPITQAPVYALVAENISNDSGIVIENNSAIGQLKYKSATGEIHTRKYNPSKVIVKKLPYYEDDESLLVQNNPLDLFSTDINKMSLDKIVAGDHIYMEIEADGSISYLNAYNHYFVRYGKVKRFEGNVLVLEDESSNTHIYNISRDTPITKGGEFYSLEQIKGGEWLKVLVCEKVLETGEHPEKVVEIVADTDTRKIDAVYKGALLGIDRYKNLLNLRNAQELYKGGWEKTNDILSLSILPNNLNVFYIGAATPLTYIERYLKSTTMPVYIATETIMGKPRVVKMSIQNGTSHLLDETTVVQVLSKSIKLKSGQTLGVQEDSVLVKNSQLIEPYNIKVGDRIRAAVTESNRLLVAELSNKIQGEQANVFRGKIKKIDEGNWFEVETFSSLEDSKWYFHGETKTFKIDLDTKIFIEEGLSSAGIEEFLGYGEDSKIGKIVTIVEENNKATAISEMPYSRESVLGTVYLADKENISLKDVESLKRNTGKWETYSNTNAGISIKANPNTVIIKNGEISTFNDIEKGDRIRVMTDETIAALTEKELTGYILIVEN